MLIAEETSDFAVVLVVNVYPILCYYIYILTCSLNLVNSLSKCSGNSPCLDVKFRVFQGEFIRVCVRERERTVGEATSAVFGYLRKRAPPLHNKSFPLCRGGRHFFYVYFLHCLLGSSSLMLVHVSRVSNVDAGDSVTGKWCSSYVLACVLCFVNCQE
jgi:hypothetical protein